MSWSRVPPQGGSRGVGVVAGTRGEAARPRGAPYLPLRCAPWQGPSCSAHLRRGRSQSGGWSHFVRVCLRWARFARQPTSWGTDAFGMGLLLVCPPRSGGRGPRIVRAVARTSCGVGGCAWSRGAEGRRRDHSAPPTSHSAGAPWQGPSCSAHLRRGRSQSGGWSHFVRVCLRWARFARQPTSWGTDVGSPSAFTSLRRNLSQQAGDRHQPIPWGTDRRRDASR